MQAEGAGTSPVPSARKNQGTRLAIVGMAIVLARAAMPRQRPHLLPLICIGLLFLLSPSDEPNLSSVDSGVRILDDAIRPACLWENSSGCG